MTLATILQFFPPALREVILSRDISDVMVNPDGAVYADFGGQVKLLASVFIEPQQLLLGVQNIARLLGGDIDESQPILDSRLPDGSRVAAVLSHGEMTVTIRKFNRWYSADQLVKSGTIPYGADGVLARAVLAAKNILVSGGTGSGKTTLAKAILDFAPEKDRLIVIEKPRELSISQPNAVRWEAHDATSGCPAVTVAQLLVAALRHRPDRIVIGEVREPASAYELLQAMNTGHSGTLSTIHADSTLDALYRLSDLALAAHSNLSADFVRAQVARTIHYVVHVERGRGGGRRVTQLARLRSYVDSGTEERKFDLEMLYQEEDVCHL